MYLLKNIYNEPNSSDPAEYIFVVCKNSFDFYRNKYAANFNLIFSEELFAVALGF